MVVKAAWLMIAMLAAMAATAVHAQEQRFFQARWFCRDAKLAADLAAAPSSRFAFLALSSSATGDCPRSSKRVPFPVRLLDPEPVAKTFDPVAGKDVVILKVLVMPQSIAVEGYIAIFADAFFPET